MSCSLYQDQILDALDGTLSGPDQEALQQHLAACPACREYRQTQLRLDAALAARLKPRHLSVAFNTKVLEQINADLRPAAASAKAEKREALQVEFESRLAELRKNLHRTQFRGLLDLTGSGAIALLLGFTLSTLLPKLSTPAALPAQLGHDPAFVVACASAAVTVAWGVMLVLRLDWMRRLAVSH